MQSNLELARLLLQLLSLSLLPIDAQLSAEALTLLYFQAQGMSRGILITISALSTAAREYIYPNNQ